MQVTLRDASRLLGVPEPTVLSWIRERGLPAIQLNGQYCFNRTEILEWSTSRGVRTTSGSSAALADALEAGGIRYGVPGGDRAAVMRAVVEGMPLPGGLDRAGLLDLLMAREALGATAVGEGIAIPHARSPLVAQVGRPAVSLGFLAQPVDFGAADGRPVGILFTLVSPTVRAHLQTLSALAAALLDPSFKAAVLAAAPRERILAEARRAGAPGEA